MTYKEHLYPVLSSAEEQVSLQLPFYLSFLSTTSLVKLVSGKVTGDKSNKSFRETALSANCHLSLPHQSTCHTWRFMKQATDINHSTITMFYCSGTYISPVFCLYMNSNCYASYEI
jgi:hypothetical protein